MADSGLCVGSFGEKLRRERELRAITIQEISSATKIGTRILTALEEEDFDKLPGGIFNKGFVRAYARYVGIDEEKAVADYLDAAKSRIPEQEFEVLASQMQEARRRDLEAAGVNGRAPGSIAAAVLAVLLLAIVAAGYHWRSSFPAAIEKVKVALKGHKAPPPATISNTQQTSSSGPAPLPMTAPAPQEPAATNPAQQAASSAAQTSPPPTAVPITATPQSIPTSNPATPAKAPQSATAEMAAPAGVTPERVTLEIQATEKSWVAITTDGEKTMQATLDPTLHSRSFKAQSRITLITGNPAGLQVTYNGKKLEPWTGPGRRMMVTFTPEGYTVQ